MATILLVDDNENVRFLIYCALSGYYQIIEAHNGQEGLEAFKKYQPALIITDLQMPRMTGLAMIREIRAIDQRVKIMALGTFFPGKEAELIAAGANLCYQKPIDIEELKRAIKELLE